MGFSWPKLSAGVNSPESKEPRNLCDKSKCWGRMAPLIVRPQLRKPRWRANPQIKKAPLLCGASDGERPAPLLVRRHAVKNRPRVGVSLINSTGRCHSLPVVPVVVGVVVGAVVGAVDRPSSADLRDATPAEPNSIAATTAAVILPVILISVLCFEKLIAKLTYGGRRL
jgi:hypothetical protein